MSITNTIMIVIGVIVILIGVLAFFNPYFTKFINAPGGPKLKATIAAIAGVIILLVGLLIELPG
jgi:uncharacterized membrane protein HdeD (DUF308 family)